MGFLLRVCALSALVPLLLGCPTVDLGDTPVAPGSCRPSRAYFETVIWPEYLAPSDPARSCVGASMCHRTADGLSSLRLAVEPVNNAANYEAATQFLNCGSFMSSPLLTKPLSKIDSHGGGDLFESSDPAVTTFSDWLNAP